MRPLLIASLLALSIAAPAAAATKVQESSTDCRTDPIDGFTYCTRTELEIRTTESDSGLITVKLVQTTHATTYGPDGTLLVTRDISVREQDAYRETGEVRVYEKINVHGTTQTTEGGAVSCLEWRFVYSNGVTHVDEVSSWPGPC
jgi:hypothetical protein